MGKKTLCLILVAVWAGGAWGAQLAPNHSSINPNLCLWLRMPEVNYDPATGVWTDMSDKGNDASVVDGFVGPTLSSGENAAVFARPFSAVHFDPGAQDLLGATDLNGGAGLTDLTIFHIIKVVVFGGTDQRGVGFGAWQDGITADCFNPSFDMTLRKNNGFISGKNQDLPLEEYVIYAARMNPSSIDMWLNTTGTLSQAFTASGSSFTTGTDQFYLGDMRYSPAGDFDIAEVVVFNTALTDEQVEGVSEWLQAFVGAKARTAATGGIPADGATDILRDAELSWTPVETAVQRDVYFGTSFDDVNDADVVNPMGVLVGQGQSATTFDPGRLEFGQTYYWRIDEANGAPDNTLFKGEVWSFTVEPVGYPIASVIATTNGESNADAGPENTVNGSGLNADDQHSVESSDMWLASPVGEEPLMIQYEFDRVYKLHQMLVWNYNVAFELLLGFGLKDVTVEYSTDGVEWTTLGDVALAQATAMETYTANSTVDFEGVAAQYVRLTVNSAHGGMGQFGLSEVRFLYVPVQVADPQPIDGATEVAVTGAALSWRAGREAASHDVYLGTDPEALPLIDSVGENTADPGALDLATTYYWRIDEVNDAEAISTWEGDVWSFSTESSIVVEDFESYTDDIDAGEAIFLTWVDGYNVAGNNSQVGYLESPFAEQTIVHGGAQAMPLIYANAGGGISEATRTFDAPQDWTQHGVKGLVIRFYGDPTNTAGTLYVKIDGTEVAYDGDADNVTKMPWQTWYIDLTGLNVASVTELTIGIEGGEGTLFVDDITLTPNERTPITPVEPDPANLISHFAFEGDASDSTGAHPGTLVGPPTFVAGKVGQAISLNGTGDHVELTGYQGVLGASAITVTAWVKTTNTTTGAIMGWGPNVGGQRFGFRIDQGRLRFEHHGGNIQGDTVMNDGTWHHVAVTIQANATVSYPEVILWLDGVDDARQTTDLDPPFDLTADQDVRIGARPAANDRFFMGEIDELYLYDRALSQAEIAYRAGRTQPFDID